MVRAVGVWLGCGLSCTTWSDKMSDRAQREFSDESASSELCDQSISFSESNTSTTTITAAEIEASEPRSLLSVLRAPKPSDLARKRKVTLNPPTGKKRSTM